MRIKTALLLFPVLLLCSCEPLTVYSDANDFPREVQDTIDEYLSKLDESEFGGLAYEKNGNLIIFTIDSPVTSDINDFVHRINASLNSRSVLLTQDVKYSFEELCLCADTLIPLIDEGSILSAGVFVPHNKVIIGVRKVTDEIKEKVYALVSEDQVEFEVVKGELQRH